MLFGTRFSVPSFAINYTVSCRKPGMLMASRPCHRIVTVSFAVPPNLYASNFDFWSDLIM